MMWQSRAAFSNDEIEVGLVCSANMFSGIGVSDTSRSRSMLKWVRKRPTQFDDLISAGVQNIHDNAYVKPKKNIQKFTPLKTCIDLKYTKIPRKKLWKINRHTKWIHKYRNKKHETQSRCLQNKCHFSFSAFSILFLSRMCAYFVLQCLFLALSRSLCNCSHKEWVLVAPYKSTKRASGFVQSPNHFIGRCFICLFVWFFFSAVLSIHPLTRSLSASNSHACVSFNFHWLIRCFRFFICA